MQKESKRQDSEENLSRRTALGLLNCQELIHNLKTQIDSRKNMKKCNPLESRLSVSGRFKNVCRLLPWGPCTKQSNKTKNNR